jgi:hypothetical protein
MRNRRRQPGRDEPEMTEENSDKDTAATRHVPYVSWALLRPGYWRSRAAIRRFRRFEQLVIHHERWGSHIDYAPPLEKLIGKKWAKQNPITEIEHQMQRLALPIMRDMELARVPHTVVLDARGGRERQRSLVADFLIFPDDWHQLKFETLMQRLENAIGQYQERKRRAVLDWFNPLFWTACVVRIPENVMEYAGFIRTADQHSSFLQVYAWVIRVLFGFVLVVGVSWLADKLGLKLPWDILTKLLG